MFRFVVPMNLVSLFSSVSSLEQIFELLVSSMDLFFKAIRKHDKRGSNGVEHVRVAHKAVDTGRT